MAHPRAALRQQTVAKYGDEDQWQAHAQRVEVQRAAAQPEITALGDIQQDGAQRRGGAGGADQSGNGAHRENATGRAALALIAEQRQPRLQRGGQLEREQAEHGERQQNKYHRQSRQDIRVLQGRLELQTGGGHHQPQRGVG